MKNLAQRLNLRPHEFRLVVFVSALVFVLLNIWLVWPHFKDWKRYTEELKAAKDKLASYQTEIAKIARYEERLRNLESQGQTILEEEQASRLISTVYAQASQKGIKVGGVQPRPKTTTTKTNAFFDEQVVSVTLNPTGDKDLVEYLLALGADDSMIRVQEMVLRPDPTQTKLMGTLLLVASYQKKPKLEPKPTPLVTTNKPALRRKS
jgi:Tfp pilus assembly protein PilO